MVMMALCCGSSFQSQIFRALEKDLPPESRMRMTSEDFPRVKKRDRKQKSKKGRKGRGTKDDDEQLILGLFEMADGQQQASK